MIIKIISAILILILVIQLIIVGLVLLVKKITSINKLYIHGDGSLSVEEEVLFYNITNVKRNPKYWNADLTNIRIYVSGKEIESFAYKADDLPNGIRVILGGMTNDTFEILRIAASVKFDLWEISFDGGMTRVNLYQNNPTFEKDLVKIKAKSFGSHINHVDHATFSEQEKELQRKKFKYGVSPHKGLASMVNNFNSTGDKVRFQLLIPSNELFNKVNIANPKAITFYYLFKGHTYKIDSEYLGSHGSLHEFSLINLKPGSIYLGLSYSTDDGKTIIPTTSLFALTRDESGLLPNIDSAEMAMPNDPNATKYEMWNEDTLVNSVGRQSSIRMYNTITKKHYESDYPDEFLALQRAREFYSDYPWLSGTNPKPSAKGLLETRVSYEEETQETKVKQKWEFDQSKLVGMGFD